MCAKYVNVLCVLLFMEHMGMHKCLYVTYVFVTRTYIHLRVCVEEHVSVHACVRVHMPCSIQASLSAVCVNTCVCSHRTRVCSTHHNRVCTHHDIRAYMCGCVCVHVCVCVCVCVCVSVCIISNQSQYACISAPFFLSLRRRRHRALPSCCHPYPRRSTCAPR